MIGLYAIIRDYGTIIVHYYFYDYLSDYFSDYVGLNHDVIVFIDYFRLFQGVCTLKMGICRRLFLTHHDSCRNSDWLALMKNACTSASTGRPTDRMESCLMERSGTIIHIIFSIVRIICLG